MRFSGSNDFYRLSSAGSPDTQIISETLVIYGRTKLSRFSGVAQTIDPQSLGGDACAQRRRAWIRLHVFS